MIRKNQQHPGKNSVLPSLGKTENKIKNRNDNPADIQVDCLFSQHNKPKKQLLSVPLWGGEINKQKLTCSSPTVTMFRAMPCSGACPGHVAMFREASPHSGGALPHSGVCPQVINCDYFWFFSSHCILANAMPHRLIAGIFLPKKKPGIHVQKKPGAQPKLIIIVFGFFFKLHTGLVFLSTKTSSAHQLHHGSSPGWFWIFFFELGMQPWKIFFWIFSSTSNHGIALMH